MKREIATALMEAMTALDGPFDELSKLADQIPDEKERKAVRKYIGESMLSIGYGLVMHIVRQYPDMDPDRKA
jgi:hypothetical protein